MVQSAKSRNVLTLYTAAEDIQCHRVRLVLAAKGIAYERVMVNPAKPPRDLLDLDPHAEIPTLVDRELVLHEPWLLCEYLDERFPHPPLMPIDPLSRARLRLATTRIERDWLPDLVAIGEGGKTATVGRKRLREHLLEALPLFKAARFFLNAELSLTDCLVAPVIWRLPWLGVDLGASGKPIADYGERLFHSQGYTRSLTPEEKAMRPA